MKLIALSAALLGYKTAEAVDCYVCSDAFDARLGSTDAGVSCWNPTDTTTGANSATVIDSSGACKTCTAQIDLVDGFPTSITRACETTDQTPLTKDYGAITCSETANAFFNHFNEDQETVLQQESKCTMDCTSDKCNTQFSLTDANANFRVCSQRDDYTNVWCDFTSGTWYCDSGFYPNGNEGSNTPGDNVPCQVTNTVTTDTFTPINCVQCNSLTDTNCFSAGTATECNDESYLSCYATSTITYDRHTGGVLKEAIVKGCSTAAPATMGTITPDQCFWSDARQTKQANANDDVFYTQKDILTTSYDQGVELVCSNRCDPSVANCNAGVPDGVISSAEETVFCAVYNSDSVTGDVKQDDDFSASIIACPAGTTGCYSKVSYMLRSNNALLFTQDFVARQTNSMSRVRVTKQERGCLTDATPEVTDAKCEQSTTFVAGTSVPATVTMHTCEEKCYGNACNTHTWPNRVKCLRTDNGAVSAPIVGGNRDYVVKACPTPADDTCYIEEYNFLTPTSHYFRTEDASTYRIGGQDLGFDTSVYRGCTIGADNYYNTGCTMQGKRGSGQKHKYEYFESCNFTCADHGCNFGTAYSGSFVQLVSPVLVLLGFAFKNL